MKKLLSILALIFVASTANAERYASCEFEFIGDGTGLEFGAIMYNLSRDGARDPENFVYKTLCNKNPNNTYKISGVTRDSNGMFQTRSYNGLHEFDVSIQGCVFLLRFGIQGNQFLVRSTEFECSNNKNSGVQTIEKQVNDGVFTVICRDGSNGTASVDGSTYCGVSSKGHNSCKANWSIESAAEYVCR